MTVPITTAAARANVLYGQETLESSKMKNIVVYQAREFYSSFPSIVRTPNGELIVAFRRAPERRLLGEAVSTHCDANSYLVLVRSKDNGETWSREPELLFAHPFGGSQDPCMVQLSDGTILCTSYGWARLAPEAAEKLENTARHGPFCFMGGYLLCSTDAGHSWSQLPLPPAVPGSPSRNVFGNPCPAYNRGCICEGKDGRLFWIVASQDQTSPRVSSTHLLISRDKGISWDYSCPVASDDKISFSETCLYETRSGVLTAFMRTANFDDHTVVARSLDGGKSFEPWEDAGFQGHPHHAVRLTDDRVFLVYGYRHRPFGIRARILDAECRDLLGSKEIVLREDGGSSDIGYPWATPLPNGKVLAVYYFNVDNATRHIAGTFVDI